jgi:hypothetical protein
MQEKEARANLEGIFGVQDQQLRFTLTSIYKFDNLTFISRSGQFCWSYQSQRSRLTSSIGKHPAFRRGLAPPSDHRNYSPLPRESALCFGLVWSSNRPALL